MIGYRVAVNGGILGCDTSPNLFSVVLVLIFLLCKISIYRASWVDLMHLYIEYHYHCGIS